MTEAPWKGKLRVGYFIEDAVLKDDSGVIAHGLKKEHAHALCDAANSGGEGGLVEAQRRIAGNEMFDALVADVISMAYGSPSSWSSKNPARWHLQEDCTPENASHHDNGITDAVRAIRAFQYRYTRIDALLGDKP